MSKIVTLRLDDDVYRRFKLLAESDNRTLSNFIETCVLRYIDKINFVDEFEMKEIKENQELNRSLIRAFQNMSEKKGKLVE